MKGRGAGLMRRMKVGNTGMEASVISMGTLSIGGDGVWGANDDTVSIRTIHRALELGIDWFDSSNFYGFGHAEEVLGQALQGRRVSVSYRQKRLGVGYRRGLSFFYKGWASDIPQPFPNGCPAQPGRVPETLENRLH